MKYSILFMATAIVAIAGCAPTITKDKAGKANAILIVTKPDQGTWPTNAYPGLLKSIGWSVPYFSSGEGTTRENFLDALNNNPCNMFYYQGHGHGSGLTVGYGNNTDNSALPVDNFAWESIVLNGEADFVDWSVVPPVKKWGYTEIIIMNCCYSNIGSNVTKWQAAFGGVYKLPNGAGTVTNMPMYCGWDQKISTALACYYATTLFSRAVGTKESIGTSANVIWSDIVGKNAELKAAFVRGAMTEMQFRDGYRHIQDSLGNISKQEVTASSYQLDKTSL